MDWSANPPELPTVPGGLQSLQDSVTTLVAKLNKIPFEGIGNDAQKTLADADTAPQAVEYRGDAAGTRHAGCGTDGAEFGQYTRCSPIPRWRRTPATP